MFSPTRFLKLKPMEPPSLGFGLLCHGRISDTNCLGQIRMHWVWITWHSQIPCAIFTWCRRGVVFIRDGRHEFNFKHAQISYKSAHHSRYRHTKRCLAFSKRPFWEIPRIYREIYRETKEATYLIKSEYTKLILQALKSQTTHITNANKVSQTNKQRLGI